MPKLSPIQWKALFLLVTFTTSFTVFCHCACNAAAMAGGSAMQSHHSCCEKTAPEKPQKKRQHSDCQGMQAVRFNLLEKQAVDPIHPSPAPLTALIQWGEKQTNTPLPQTEKSKLPQQWSYKHSPPNLFSLYQCFLI